MHMIHIYYICTTDLQNMNFLFRKLQEKLSVQQGYLLAAVRLQFSPFLITGVFLWFTSKYMLMMSIKPATKYVKFIAPQSGVQTQGEANTAILRSCIIIQETRLLYFNINLRKITCLVIILIKLSTLLVKFMAHWSGVQALGRCHYGYIVKMNKLLENLLFYSHINLKLNTTLKKHFPPYFSFSADISTTRI